MRFRIFLYLVASTILLQDVAHVGFGIGIVAIVLIAIILNVYGYSLRK